MIGRRLGGIAAAALSAVVMSVGVYPATSLGAASSFSDVPVGHPFATEIEWLAGTGVARGYADGSFDPGGVVSRQAVAAFLFRFAGEPDVPLPSSPTFSDVPLGHPFQAAVEMLAISGMSRGYADGTFHPVESVTRQSAAAFLGRLDGGEWPEFNSPAATIFESISVVDGDGTIDLGTRQVHLVPAAGFLATWIGCGPIEVQFQLDGAEMDVLSIGRLEGECLPEDEAADAWLVGLFDSGDIELRRIGNLVLLRSADTTITFEDTGEQLFPNG
jgi:hypothetical protein